MRQVDKDKSDHLRRYLEINGHHRVVQANLLFHKINPMTMDQSIALSLEQMIAIDQ